MFDTLMWLLHLCFSYMSDGMLTIFDSVVSPIMTALGVSTSVPASILTMAHKGSMLIEVVMPTSDFIAGCTALLAAFAFKIAGDVFRFCLHAVLKILALIGGYITGW